MSNIFIGLKKTCLGVLEREKRDKENETDLKEGGLIEMSTTVLPFAMLAPSLEYSPINDPKLIFLGRAAAGLVISVDLPLPLLNLLPDLERTMCPKLLNFPPVNFLKIFTWL